MKIRELIIIICNIVLLVLLCILFFFPSGRWFKRDHAVHHISDSRFLEMMRDKLKLSDDQYASITSIYARDEKIRKASRVEIVKKYYTLEALLLNDTFDEPAVRKTLEEIDRLKREEFFLLMKNRHEASKLLTPEQQEIFNNDVRSRMKRFRDRFESPGQRLPDND